MFGTKAFACGVILLLGYCGADQPCETVNRRPKFKTLVVSFDGFALHYLNSEKFALPWFRRLQREGVFTESMQSVFPGETFPNHYSMVTGLYPESHGIVSNIFFDAATNKSFTSKRYGKPGGEKNFDRQYWAAKPIWITAKELGITETAISMWPGALVEGYESFHHRNDFSASVKFESRIDEIVEWLSEDNVDLGLLFSFEPDDTGHDFGTHSRHMEETLSRCDWQLGYLIRSLGKAGFNSSNLNLVVISDHGMWNIRNDINLEEILPGETKFWFERITRFGALLSMWPQPGKRDTIVTHLKAALKLPKYKGYFSVYNKCELPESFHYCNSSRIPPLMLLSTPGNYVGPREFSAKATKYIANHGSNVTHYGMRPIFIARGPMFKRNGYNATRSTRGMETKDIYAVISHLIGYCYEGGVNASIATVNGLFH